MGVSDMTVQEIRALSLGAAVQLNGVLAGPVWFTGGELRQPLSADDVTELNRRGDIHNAAIIDRTLRIAARFEQWVKSGDTETAPDGVPADWADDGCAG